MSYPLRRASDDAVGFLGYNLPERGDIPATRALTWADTASGERADQCWSASVVAAARRG
jgi:hypothetical protein